DRHARRVHRVRGPRLGALPRPRQRPGLRPLGLVQAGPGPLATVRGHNLRRAPEERPGARRGGPRRRRGGPPRPPRRQQRPRAGRLLGRLRRPGARALAARARGRARPRLHRPRRPGAGAHVARDDGKHARVGIDERRRSGQEGPRGGDLLPLPRREPRGVRDDRPEAPGGLALAGLLQRAGAGRGPLRPLGRRRARSLPDPRDPRLGRPLRAPRQRPLPGRGHTRRQAARPRGRRAPGLRRAGRRGEPRGPRVPRGI
ncbi:MAG: Beta-ketoadipate enol-lactone hydrolase, partial [uncultured Rubrobacteraceae bacterium]